MNNKALSKVQMTHFKGNALWNNVGNLNNRHNPLEGFENQKQVLQERECIHPRLF